MGNSTIRLQDVMDSIAAIGDIATVFDHTAGWADEPALSIGNDVMGELLSIRFPWKWNRVKIVPFPLTSLQQDYASLTYKGLGWLENGLRVDINNWSTLPQRGPSMRCATYQWGATKAAFRIRWRGSITGT